MYQSKQSISIKHGDTFNLVCQLKNDDDTPIDISNAVISSQVKDIKKNLITTLIATKTQAPKGAFLLAANTALPVGVLFIDVLIEQENSKRHSETLRLNVLEAVTDG